MSGLLERNFLIDGHVAKYMGVSRGLEFYQITVGGVRILYGYDFHTRGDVPKVAVRVPEGSRNMAELLDVGG